MRQTLKKFLPFVLLFLGAALVAGAGYVFWQAALPQPAAEVPADIAGLERGETLSGQAGIKSIEDLHGTSLAISAGTVATYGKNEANLWLADAGSESGALDLIKEMEAKIEAGNSPFTPMGVFQFRGRDVYLLSGMDQTHFYAQSGSRVFWMSVAPDLAEQALKELLEFYP